MNAFYFFYFPDPILPDILAKLDPGWENRTSPAAEAADINSNGKYGFLVAAKGAAQFLFNPFVGLIVTRYVSITHVIPRLNDV